MAVSIYDREDQSENLSSVLTFAVLTRLPAQDYNIEFLRIYWSFDTLRLFHHSVYPGQEFPQELTEIHLQREKLAVNLRLSLKNSRGSAGRFDIMPRWATPILRRTQLPPRMT